MRGIRPAGSSGIEENPSGMAAGQRAQSSQSGGMASRQQSVASAQCEVAGAAIVSFGAAAALKTGATANASHSSMYDASIRIRSKSLPLRAVFGRIRKNAHGRYSAPPIAISR
jgi:hypothetical protein